jgi:hypothetical protein
VGGNLHRAGRLEKYVSRLKGHQQRTRADRRWQQRDEICARLVVARPHVEHTTKETFEMRVLLAVERAFFKAVVEAPCSWSDVGSQLVDNGAVEWTIDLLKAVDTWVSPTDESRLKLRTITKLRQL